MNNQVKINDAVNRHFICCNKWLVPRKVQPEFHALLFLRCLLQNYSIMALWGEPTSVMTHQRPLSHVIVTRLRFCHIRSRELLYSSAICPLYVHLKEHLTVIRSFGWRTQTHPSDNCIYNKLHCSMISKTCACLLLSWTTSLSVFWNLFPLQKKGLWSCVELKFSSKRFILWAFSRLKKRNKGRQISAPQHGARSWGQVCTFCVACLLLALFFLIILQPEGLL